MGTSFVEMTDRACACGLWIWPSYLHALGHEDPSVSTRADCCTIGNAVLQCHYWRKSNAAKFTECEGERNCMAPGRSARFEAAVCLPCRVSRWVRASWERLKLRFAVSTAGRNIRSFGSTNLTDRT